MKTFSVVLAFLLLPLNSFASSAACKDSAIHAAVAVANSREAADSIGKILDADLGSVVGQPKESVDSSRNGIKVLKYQIAVSQADPEDGKLMFSVTTEDSTCWVLSVESKD